MIKYIKSPFLLVEITISESQCLLVKSQTNGAGIPMTKAQGQLLMGFDISQGQHLVTPGLREENMIWIDMGVS